MEITYKQKQRLLDVCDNCKTGRASNQHYKQELIRLYNELYKQNVKLTTNCSSCIQECYNGIKKIIENL